MADKVQTVLKVTPDTRSRFRELAEQDGRTMSGMLTYLVLQEQMRRARASAARREGSS